MEEAEGAGTRPGGEDSYAGEANIRCRPDRAMRRIAVECSQKECSVARSGMMKKTEIAHLVPALVFGGLLGIMLIARGISLGDALLVVCATYAFVSLVESLFETGTSTSVQPKP
jgi:hypothetical protein